MTHLVGVSVAVRDLLALLGAFHLDPMPFPARRAFVLAKTMSRHPHKARSASQHLYFIAFLGLLDKYNGSVLDVSDFFISRGVPNNGMEGRRKRRRRRMSIRRSRGRRRKVMKR